MSNPIRVGIAGQGRSGWGIHARMFEGLGDMYQVVAVADLDENRQEEAADRFGCPTYNTLTDMLSNGEIELVVNSLPSYLHPSGAIEALRAGKHVVCEKPMAVRVADADRMIAAAKESGRVLTIFQQRRYAPDFTKVREVIASGVLGRIIMIRLAWQSFGRRWDWQTMYDYDGGSLNNTGPHMLDWALQLFGPGKPEVICHLERTLTLGNADDHVKVILRGEGAPMLDLEITSACAYPQEPWLVLGTQGTLAGTTKDLRWKYIDPAQLAAREVDTTPTEGRTYNREEYVWTEKTWNVSEYEGPGYTGYYLDLYRAIREGAPLAITPEDIRRQVEVLEACHHQTQMPPGA